MNGSVLVKSTSIGVQIQVDVNSKINAVARNWKVREIKMNNREGIVYRAMNDIENWSTIITSYNARKIIFGSCKYGGNNVELAIIIYTPIVNRIELNGDPKMSDSHSSSSMALAKHVPKIWSPKTFKRNAQNVWSNFAILPISLVPL